MIDGNKLTKALSGATVSGAPTGHTVNTDGNTATIETPPISGEADFDLILERCGFDPAVYEIDGNDMGQMVAALDLAAVTKNGKPKCIFGHTVKGEGVSFMENQCGWHGVAPNDQEYQQAMAELDRQYVKC